MKEIVQEGAPILREEATPVPEHLFGTPELRAIIRAMEEALAPEEDGVALAAPQIGIPYRIFIVRVDRTLPPVELAEGEPVPPKPAPEVAVYINPAITKTSRKSHKVDEGCLSVRGVYGTTRRHERATIKAQDATSKSFTRGAGGLMAQIFEHETDHLNGILFIDHAVQLIEIKDAPHAA